MDNLICTTHSFGPAVHSATSRYISLNKLNRSLDLNNVLIRERSFDLIISQTFNWSGLTCVFRILMGKILVKSILIVVIVFCFAQFVDLEGFYSMYMQVVFGGRLWFYHVIRHENYMHIYTWEINRSVQNPGRQVARSISEIRTHINSGLVIKHKTIN